ncbi:hypothetical protein F4781DRAFT_413273 [Annulohypoxylon bovei var. microspora]|nr:hypothetical protein F4781DRAFT_413273 [Annulohypoxylon bovei var. microspora]
MPSAQPTCAARIIRNNFIKCGWGAVLTKETNDVVTKVKEDAGAMYQLQVSRTRRVSSKSLMAALFWEHRHLSEQMIVSTPSVDEELEFNLFSVVDASFETGLDTIRKSFSDDYANIQMHPMFGPMRDRPYTVWPILMDGVWVTIILEVSPMEMVAPGCQVYFDRQVTKFTVIDPLYEGQDARRALLEQRLPEILEEGCIQLLPAAMTASFLRFGIQENWATGLVAYAVSREFLRRLRVLLYRKEAKAGELQLNFLWSEFEEHYDFDAYRQLLMAACANQTIEKSGFAVRLALEVPSEKSDHNPSALKHDNFCLPDEAYKRTKHSTRNVIVEIPEEKREKPIIQEQPIGRQPWPESKPDDLETCDSVADESDLEPQQDKVEDLMSKEPVRGSQVSYENEQFETDASLFGNDNTEMVDTPVATIPSKTPRLDENLNLPYFSDPDTSYSPSNPSFPRVEQTQDFTDTSLISTGEAHQPSPRSPLQDYVESANTENSVLSEKRPLDDVEESSSKRQRVE